MRVFTTHRSSIKLQSIVFLCTDRTCLGLQSFKGIKRACLCLNPPRTGHTFPREFFLTQSKNTRLDQCVHRNHSQMVNIIQKTLKGLCYRVVYIITSQLFHFSCKQEMCLSIPRGAHIWLWLDRLTDM